MVEIRLYRESDAQSVGVLIADTYSGFNLSFASPNERRLFLGPFQYAHSMQKEHREAITCVIRSAIVLVAEEEGEIVGVLRGRKERLGSLFVRGDCHRRGIGRCLVEHFGQWSQRQGVSVIRVAATLYGMPFYVAMGYRRSTGVRSSRSFDGHGMPTQPMHKVLA